MCVMECSSSVHWSTPKGMQAVVAPVRARTCSSIHSTPRRGSVLLGYDRYQRPSTPVHSSKVHPEALNSPLRGNIGRNVQNDSPHSVARAKSDWVHAHTHRVKLMISTPHIDTFLM